jgi:hypothetical protein
VSKEDLLKNIKEQIGQLKNQLEALKNHGAASLETEGAGKGENFESFIKLEDVDLLTIALTGELPRDRALAAAESLLLDERSLTNNVPAALRLFRDFGHPAIFLFRLDNDGNLEYSFELLETVAEFIDKEEAKG